jgi:hypothetical protein
MWIRNLFAHHLARMIIFLNLPALMILSVRL